MYLLLSIPNRKQGIHNISPSNSASCLISDLLPRLPNIPHSHNIPAPCAGLLLFPAGFYYNPCFALSSSGFCIVWPTQFSLLLLIFLYIGFNLFFPTNPCLILLSATTFSLFFVGICQQTPAIWKVVSWIIFFSKYKNNSLPPSALHLFLSLLLHPYQLCFKLEKFI